MNKIKKLILILVALLIIAELIYVLVAKEKGESRQISEEQRVHSLIEDVGFERGYEEVKALAGEDYKKGHVYLHILGQELYDARGIEGVELCDASYGYGCYHGFLSTGLFDKGLSLIADAGAICLDKTKVESPTGCEHGIGHGLLEYFGHDEIEAALDACGSLSWKEKLYGCPEGVFMEYNFPTLIRDENILSTSRLVDPDRPFDPCPTISDSFREACYYSLPQLWFERLSKDFRLLGEVCGNIMNKNERMACYYGLGNIVPIENDFEIEKVIDVCSAMTSEESNIGCRIFSARSFKAFEAPREIIERLCIEKADDKLAEECLRTIPGNTGL